MVFPSVPIYLDPPNWNQQPTHQQGSSGAGGIVGRSSDGHQLRVPPVVPVVSQPNEAAAAMAMAGSTERPMSMAERARLAKIPQPEPALKCPRCDSTNTKFCYFNNYSLSQPRHFCKTCRRYWTRGGALRNVPVGGGCRRNKRSKASSSKSASASADRQSGGASSTSSTATASSTGAISSSNISLPPQLPFLGSLHSLADYPSSNVGLNFTGIQPIDTVEYQVGSSSTSMGLEQWRLQQIQQFPFLGGLDHQGQAQAVPEQSSMFPFDQCQTSTGYVGPKTSNSGLISQLASIKMEDRSHHGMNLPREYLRMQPNDQFWALGAGGGSGSAAGGGGVRSSSGASSGAWTNDLPGFNSCSSGNLL